MTSTDRVLDDLLVVRAQEGSRAAFATLIERWQERLWRHAYRLSGREDIAWDVLQEGWIAMARNLPKLREPGAFRGWAYTIITRTAVDRSRRQRPDQQLTDGALADLSSPTPASNDRERAVLALRDALRQLSAEQRALVSLHYLEGLPLRELACVFDVPEGTVKSRLHRARQTLKEILEKGAERFES